jgi:hypothetical protein
MKESLKKEWIAALRSGEYKQGEGFLHTADTEEFCCLGVLCDIAIDGDWIATTSGSGRPVWSLDGSSGMPTGGTLDQLGLRASVASRLAAMNDSDDSFEKIARYLSRKKNLG